MNDTPLPIFSEVITMHARHRLPTKRSLTSITERCDEKLILPFDQRQKARQRARLCSGREIGIRLPRGTVLRGGDYLRSADGALVEVVAAHEPVSTVRTRNVRELTRAAYHLGNRHVALEVGTSWIRYLADHVLDSMVEQMGLVVIHEEDCFEPEAGAYAGHEHGHAHPHPHEHGHNDSDDGAPRVIFGGVPRTLWPRNP